MSRRHYARSRRRPEQGSGCLGAIAWMGVLVLLLLAGYGLAVRPLLSEYVGEQAAAQLAGPENSASDPANPGQAAVDQAAAALPNAVAALPSGELVILEQDVNAYIGANPQAISPLDQANLRFSPGVVTVDLRAYGLSGSAAATLRAENGRIVADNPQIDGPLGLALSGPQIIEPFVARLNSELTRQGRAIDDVRIEQGRMVVVTR